MIVTGIYLKYNDACYTNGSYFASDYLVDSILICDTNRTTNFTFSGEALLPNGSICNMSSRPIQCTHKEGTNGFALVLRPIASYFTDEVGYKCCLPYSCDNDNTDIIIANIYGKWIQ